MRVFSRSVVATNKSLKEDRPVLPQNILTVGSLAHECALKEALSSQVYPHAFLTGGHARIEKEISDKPNSGLALDQDPLAPYRIAYQLPIHICTP